MHGSFINFPVPNVVSNFRILSEDSGVSDISITLSWDEPAGVGAEAIVDQYMVSFTPQPLSDLAVNYISALSFNVTLKYNELYNAGIRAENCAGSSVTSSRDIIYSK